MHDNLLLVFSPEFAVRHAPAPASISDSKKKPLKFVENFEIKISALSAPCAENVWAWELYITQACEEAGIPNLIDRKPTTDHHHINFYF